MAVNEQEGIRAILEADATGEVAEIYSDIRKVLGTSVVNIIWRHIATMPGALHWTWSSVRPLYTGQATLHAEALRRAIALPARPSFSTDTLAAAGLTPADLVGIRDILESYHYTSALALVVLSALLAQYEPGNADSALPTDTAPGPPGVTLPSLLPLASLAPEVVRLIEELNGFGEDASPLPMANMYRHLAYWPPFLALVRTMLTPLEAEGRLQALARSIRVLAGAHGQALAPSLKLSPPPESLKEVLVACRLFVEHPIARMTGICALVRSTMS